MSNTPAMRFGASNKQAATGHGGRRRPLLDVEMLKLVLSDELDLMSDDDIEFMPDELVRAHLCAVGIDRLSGTRRLLDGLGVRPSASVMDDGDHRPGTSPVAPSLHVPRPVLVSEFLQQLQEHRMIHFTGPARSGRTFFLNVLFGTEPAVRAAYPRIVRIDCSGLRMRTPALFEREAVWALFGKRDDAFRRFWSGVGGFDPDAETPLITLLKRTFNATRGLVVIDHAEYLHRGGEMDRWLSATFLDAMSSAGIDVVACSRSPDAARPLKSLSELTGVPIPPIGPDEIAAWLQHPLLTEHYKHGLEVEDILRVTGGSPALLRDLGDGILHAMHMRRPVFGACYLAEFERDRAERYMTDCERYVRAARRIPQVLTQGSQALAIIGATKRKILDRFLATGAVVAAADGTLRFRSAIHARRIAALTTPENVARLLLVGDLTDLAASGDLRTLKECAELASVPLANMLTAERTSRQALARFQELLGRWGLMGVKSNGPELHVRDPANARLWRPYDTDQPYPLSSFEQPDFARAAQTGQVTSSETGELFFPLTGNSGFVEMVVIGRLRPDLSRPQRTTAIERLVGIMRGLRPTLAQLLERIAFRKAKKFRERLAHRAPLLDASSIVGALREANCTAVAVFERSQGTPAGWIVTTFEQAGRTEQTSLAFLNKELLELSNAQCLDGIAEHPSGRGLVISGESAWTIFPRLRDADVAIYLRAVWMHNGGICRLVAFLFGGDASRSIDGDLQCHLSTVAPKVVAAAS